MNYKIAIINTLLQFCMVVMISVSSYGHGEDTTGPHGGVIRMPGAFHTEAIIVNKSTVAIYLLDINIKNPTTKESTVSATIMHDKKLHPLTCTPKEDKFECDVPENTNLLSGELVVMAKRGEIQGVEARYPLPLHTSTESSM